MKLHIFFAQEVPALTFSGVQLDTSSNHSATGGSREVLKGKRTPEEIDFWFHLQVSYHLQQIQE